MAVMNYSLIPILTEDSFTRHKSLSLDIAAKYMDFKPKKAKEVLECGQVLFFNHQRHLQTNEHRLQLDEMYTCKDRFCPFCNWRRSRKLGLQSYAVLDQIQKEHEVRFVFLTLTVKNPRLDDTREVIRHMMKSFQRLSQTRRYKNSVLGHLRALEVHPQKTDHNYTHPHFHVLLIVKPSYFNRAHADYISHKEWTAMWRKALRADYDPSVDVRVIRSKNPEVDPIASVVAEACKYPVKSTDLSGLSSPIFQVFTEQMHRVRNLAFGGIFKEYRARLSLDDVEDGDLIHDLPEDDAALWETIERLRYAYEMGDYGLNYYLQK
jgi:plasmid rolling circle replication initiator protein Rep